MTNADKFKNIFGLYATELWSMPAKDFLKWLNSEVMNCSEIPNNWIPCSERLPEEDDYKSCIECLDGAVWYFTENGTKGLGYYYKSTKEWSTTDDLKTDGKVVAWMPLPVPFQPKEDES